MPSPPPPMTSAFLPLSTCAEAGDVADSPTRRSYKRASDSPPRGPTGASATRIGRNAVTAAAARAAERGRQDAHQPTGRQEGEEEAGEDRAEEEHVRAMRQLDQGGLPDRREPQHREGGDHEDDRRPQRLRAETGYRATTQSASTAAATSSAHMNTLTEITRLRRSGRRGRRGGCVRSSQS